MNIYKLKLSEGQSFTARVLPAIAASHLDPVVSVFDVTGELQYQSDNAIGSDGIVSFVVPQGAAGIYYVGRVQRGQLQPAGPDRHAGYIRTCDISGARRREHGRVYADTRDGTWCDA